MDTLINSHSTMIDAEADKKHKPRKKAKSKPKVKAKAKVKVKKPSKHAAVKHASSPIKGKGKYSRVCALKSCGQRFRTDDERKRYHSRACGNKNRSKRWYQAAAAALRKLRKKR